MSRKMDNDELIRLTSEATELDERLSSIRDRKAEDESALAKLDERHWEMVRRINDIAEELHRATDELRTVARERVGRNDELRYQATDIRELERNLRTVKRMIQDGVGRDVCPKCGSTEIATIIYGYPMEESDVDPLENDHVMGGCVSDSEETVCCMACDKRFIGNFEKWQRAQSHSNEPETVLEIGAEGGSLAIVRQRNERGTWEYWCLRDETIMLDLLSEDDIGNRDDLYDKSARMSCFEDALLRLDTYPWHSLYPMMVSDEFTDSVLQEVEKRSGKEAVVAWVEKLKGFRNLGKD